MEKKKVLHFLRELEIGGIQEFIINVENNIQNYEFDFVVESKGFYDEYFKSKGCQIFYLPGVRKCGTFVYKKKLKKFFLEHREYEIIHSHYNQMSGLIAEIAKKSGIKKIIVHSHSSSSSTSLLGKIYKKFYENKIPKYATNLVACSKEASNYLFKNYTSEALIIFNGIDFNKFRFNEKLRNELRSKLCINDDTIVIGHTGRMVNVKNHSFLIDLFNEYQKNHNSLLLLIGDGPEKDNIVAKVEKYGLLDKVIFLGSIDEVWKYYNIMDMFIFPSKYEGLGISLVEAQVNGLPIISSDKIPKIVNFSNKISFFPINEKELWLEEMGKIKIKRFKVTNEMEKSCFNIENTILQIENLYSSNNKIKVLNYVPSYNYGGIESYTFNVNYQLKDSCEFTYVVEVDLNDKTEKKILALNSSIIRINNLTKESCIKNLFEIINIFKTNKFDVVHVHDCNLRFFLMLLSKIYKVPVRIYHIHSISLSGNNSIFKFIKKICLYFNILNSNIILSCSEEAAKKKLFKHQKYQIASNGIEVEKFFYDVKLRNSLRNNFKIKYNEKVLLFVGRLEAVKNVLFLIEIMNCIVKKDCNYKLIIIGDGSEKVKIKDKIEQYNLFNNIIMIDHTDNVYEYYSCADLFCLPSINEGLGIVLIEAQTNGLPCIASTGVPVETNFSGNVKYLNLEMNNWIDYILNGKYTRYNYQKEFLLSNYNIKNSSKCLLDIYGGKND